MNDLVSVDSPEARATLRALGLRKPKPQKHAWAPTGDRERVYKPLRTPEQAMARSFMRGFGSEEPLRGPNADRARAEKRKRRAKRIAHRVRIASPIDADEQADLLAARHKARNRRKRIARRTSQE